MKQLLQNLKTGEGVIADVPVPVVQRGRVLVRTAASLISAGTERAFVELAQKSMAGKAKERPDLIKKVFENLKNDGLLKTLRTVRDKLGESHALGYSAAGVIIEVGADVTEFRVGERVACAGTGYAGHAEVLGVPKNLCVRLPDNVDFESGAFATLGAIALQGLRLAEPTLAESVVVIGLGLVGQLTVQLLKANGCRVFGIDLDETKIELACTLGADEGCVPSDARTAVSGWSRGRGADAVIIAAATQSDQPIELAGEISRLKGRVVAVGMVGMNVPRNVYYLRELALKVSMSYGPGRYDPEYEERGHDYPLAYVRWTEGRNIEAFLDLCAIGSVQVAPLITHRIPIEDGNRAYRLISSETTEPYLGIILLYDTERKLERIINNRASAVAPGTKRAKRVQVGLIGAGKYVQSMLLPHFKRTDVDFRCVATASGVSARDVGKRYGFARAVSAADEVLNDDEVNLVVVGTQHDLHARLAQQALERNRHVFVEKPLALDDAELNEVLVAAANSTAQLMVGFNRRFSPLSRKAQGLFAEKRAPMSILYRVNGGRIPREHWTQDPRAGGGRIIGEVCHFIDLMQFWIGAPPVSVFAEAIAADNHKIVNADSVFVTLRFADGSNGCIAYLSEGDKALPKERIELFCEGKSFVIDDFRGATLYQNGREHKTRLRSQDKGQAGEVMAVCKVVLEGLPFPITLAELAATTRATFRINESLRTGKPIAVS